ncbi:hydrogenase maturation protease [Clostridium estertheticum]|nr:hydrogenase maturation protease [Clostridium estertheticum]MBX4264199.1 hydrogenase maturation protease [Clostridium estertheticum]MBX4267766.1 hydrogenase maturation protease [Clostridium estertheticum]WLC78010.1 hydrogenase maturation protease [Clostridium estertheticum]WLC89056.1 hydrogenase maturation protease [Clostridium estertheticum]
MLMMDDGVALLILDKIKKRLEDKGIETIIGETDVEFCFSLLNELDVFYIMDSTYYGNVPGTVTFKSLDDIKKFKDNSRSIHSLGLIDLINMYRMDIKGYFIGIEISNIDINLGLSNILQGRVEDVSQKVIRFII